MFGNTSCKDETDCKMEIVVKLYNDTTIVVPNANVLVHQGDINIIGTTDAMGKFEHTFALEAIFNVKVTDSSAIDTTVTPPIPIYRIGEGSVRLKEGTSVRKLILIK